MKKIFISLMVVAVAVTITSNASFAQSTLTNTWQGLQNFNHSDAGTLVESFYDAGTQSNHMLTATLINNYSNLNISDRDQTGTIQWSATIAKPGYTYWTSNKLIADENGNATLSGSVYNSTQFRYEIFVIKVNTDGLIDWSTFISDEHNYLLFTGLERTATGDYYLSYWYAEYNAQGEVTSEVEVHKLNGSDGSTIWEAVQEFPGQYTATNAMISTGSGLYLTGYTSNANSGYDIITLKFDLNGNFAWQQTYSTGEQFSYTIGWDLAANNDDEIVIAALDDYNKILAIGYNSDGSQSFTHTKSFPGNSSYVYGLQIEGDGNGGTYLASQSSHLAKYQIYLEKLNQDGIQEWEKFLDDDYFTRMKADPAGQGVWILGSVYNSNINNYLYRIHAISPSGLSWLNYQFKTYRGYNAVADFDTPDGISVFLTGSIPVSQFSTDELTARWDVQPLKSGQLSFASHVLIYPNPCSDYAFIESATGADLVLVYDVTGRQIANYADVTDATKINTDTWNAGTYLVKIITGSEQEIVKLVKE